MSNVRRSQAGFSAIELLVGLGIIAVMVGLASPGISAYMTQQATRESARDVASLLGKARSRALKDGIPYLVYFNDATASTRAVVVRDNDASYSVTPGDSMRRVRLALQRNPDVYALGDAVVPLWMNSVPMLDSATSSTALAPGSAGSGTGSGPGPSSNSGPGSVRGPSSGPGSGLVVPSAPTGTSTLATPTLSSGLRAGTSFPIDSSSSRPALAFNTRGLPVATDRPNTVASGSGVFYLTNASGALFGVRVNPLGAIEVHQWDGHAQVWN
ncbi:MAG: Tfp pilus assembly protein FimT/FimU [Myxococcota bacterium]